MCRVSTPAYPRGVDGTERRGGHRHGGLWVDVGFAVGVFAVIAVAITADLPDVRGTRQLDGYAYLFAVGLGALMLVRRQFPTATLLATAFGTCAYYIFQYPPIGLALPMGAALYVAAEAGRLRWAAATAAAVLGLSLYFRIVQGEQLRYLLLYDTVLTIAVMAVAIALGAARRAQRLWRLEVQERARQTALVHQQQAHQQVEQERARIARDLHDSLAHTISVVALQADVALESSPDLPEPTVQAIGRMREASRRAMTELRSAVGVLRTPEPSAPTPTLADVDLLARDLSGGGMAVRVDRVGDLGHVPPFVAATAYRIVQESLTNAARHGKCRHATVDLRVTDRDVAITVSDDGVGGDRDAGQPSGHGIRGMVERAQILGGTVIAGAQPSGGWRVHAVLPVLPR